MNDVIEVLQQHFEPKPQITAEHFHFHRRDQLPTETVAEYEAQLHRLSAKCKFGAHLDDALHDRLVCGLRSEAMHKRLLSMKDLMFQEALDTAQAIETADKSTKTLQGPEPASVNQFKFCTRSNPVKKHSTEQKQSTAVPCYRYGKLNHASSNCRFIDATCHHCQKKGHNASVC